MNATVRPSLEQLIQRAHKVLLDSRALLDSIDHLLQSRDTLIRDRVDLLGHIAKIGRQFCDSVNIEVSRN